MWKKRSCAAPLILDCVGAPRAVSTSAAEERANSASFAPLIGLLSARYLNWSYPFAANKVLIPGTHALLIAGSSLSQFMQRHVS
jgi:hypothetical protein